MKTQKLLLKTLYSMAGLLILTSVGFNIYQYQRNKKLVTKDVAEKSTKNESTGNSNNGSKPTPLKTVQNNTHPLSNENMPSSGGKKEIEDQLNITEEKIDRTSEELSKEVTKKDDFKKSYEQFSKNMTSDPAYQKIMRDSQKDILKDYDPLSKKLGISKEEFKEFKGILADRMLEIQNAVLPNIDAVSDEEKAGMNQRVMEINNRYKDKVNEFLGEEKSSIYVSYQKRLSERSSLNYFLETVPLEKRISDEQTDAIIDTMYTGRMEVFEKMGPDLGMNSSVNLTEENINHEIEKYKLVYDKYVEATRGILPDDQVEQFKNHLNRSLMNIESMYKMRLFMNKNN